MSFSKRYFTLFCVVLCAQTLFSQNNLSEGYYVGLKKDTVHGFFNLDDLENGKVFFYANKTTSVNQKLTPDNIQQIETLNSLSIRTFIYTHHDQREPLFITKYADGNVTLYKGHSSNPDEEELFLISSIKMPLIRKISQGNPREFLNTYFKGCALGTNFSVRYTQYSILAAVTEISKCAFPNAKIEKIVRKSAKIHVEIGLKTALYVGNSYVKNWLGDKKGEVNVQPLVGIIGGFHISNSIKFYAGYNLFQRQFINNDRPALYCSPQLIYGCYATQPFSFVTKFAEIPFAVHYEFNKNKPTYIPKFFFGGSILKALNSKIDEYGVVTRNKGLINTAYTTGLPNTSFFIGGGVKRILKNKSIIELNLKYAYEVENPVDLAAIYSNRLELAFVYLLAL
jgi:hypothetical protein